MFFLFVMAYVINLKTYSDHRGNLTSIEKILPFDIKRVYYIYDVCSGIGRGGHRHKKTVQALISLRGISTIFVSNKSKEEEFVLNKPDICLILNPEDRHSMKFSDDAILMVLASEYFDPDDYVADAY